MSYAPGPLLIPGLPERLRAVPAIPQSAEDPEIEHIRRDFLDWKSDALKYRRLAWRRCGERVWGDTGKTLDPSEPEIDPAEVENFRQLEIAKSAKDPVYLKTIWLAVHETRGGFGRTKGWQPAIPYPYQVAYLRWRRFVREMAEQQDERITAACSKPRTMGVTWDLCFDDLHGWLFEEAFVAKLVSETAAKVDSGSLDSLFSRITSQFDWKRGRPVGNPLALPKWLWPKGFDRERDKVDMLLVNPETGNELNGEGTKSTTGRAGRASVGDIDEVAAIKGARYVVGAMTETVGLIYLTSSESVKEDTFFVEYVQDLKAQHSPYLFEIEWWMHPHYTQQWLEATKADYARKGDLPAFEREILRKGESGLSAYCYPKARHTTVGHFPYVPGSPTWVGFDPGSDDETAMVVLCRDLVSGRYRVLTAYSNRSQEPEFYASLLAGIEDDRFQYGHAEHAFMDALRPMIYPEFLYGDPYGTHKMVGNASWYTKMTVWWDEQEDKQREAGTPKRLKIPIVVNWKRKGEGAGRNLQERRNSLSAMLDRMDFHDDPEGQVRETLRAIQMVKWDVDDRTAEQRAPRHLQNHQYTHRTSALEFFAVNREFAPIDATNDDDFKPYRAA